MAQKKGQCINFGACRKADTKEQILIDVGMDFVCPECGGALIESGDANGAGNSFKKNKWVIPAAIIACLLIVLVVGGWYLLGKQNGGKNNTKQAEKDIIITPQPDEKKVKDESKKEHAKKTDHIKNDQSKIPLISWDEADKYYGQTVKVKGRIVSTNNTGQVCYLNFHYDWSKYLTATIFNSDFDKFPPNPEEYYKNKNVIITGQVDQYKSKPQLILKDKSQIQIDNGVSENNPANNTISSIKLVGSSTIASKLAPALAKGYMEKIINCNEIQTIEKDAKNGFNIKCNLSNKSIIIEILSLGSETAFPSLKDGTADIGMSARRIKEKEAAELSSLGDMFSSKNEHVIAVEGLSVIVNQSNPIEKLSVEQLSDIFSGKIKNWSDVGGDKQSINIVINKKNQNAIDLMKNLVLIDKNLTSNIYAINNDEELLDYLSKNRNAISFVDNYINQNNQKTIKVYKDRSLANAPTTDNIKREDYLLSQRLYFYTSESSNKPHIKNFINFIQSRDGQEIVEKILYPPPDIVPKQKPPYPFLPQNAKQKDITFRFKSNSYELDNKALADMQRLKEELKYEKKKIILVGFTDSIGDEKTNIPLSVKRAEVIKNELSQANKDNIYVYGLGEEYPIDSNFFESGRQKNRRVEVWLDKI